MGQEGRGEAETGSAFRFLNFRLHRCSTGCTSPRMPTVNGGVTDAQIRSRGKDFPSALRGSRDRLGETFVSAIHRAVDIRQCLI